MSEAPIPDDLVALQRDVYTAQLAADGAGDDAERDRLRDAERAAILALHRHPARAQANWRDLRKAALGEK